MGRRTYLPTYIPTYLPTYLPTYVHTYLTLAESKGETFKNAHLVCVCVGVMHWLLGCSSGMSALGDTSEIYVTISDGSSTREKTHLRQQNHSQVNH